MWSMLTDSRGRLKDGSALYRAVIAAGVAQASRQKVWPFLLGCYPLEATVEQQSLLLAEAGAELETLSRQLSGGSASSRFSKGARDNQSLEDVLRQIQLDVDRTETSTHIDESRPQFCQRLTKLLNAYAVHDPEIGYCQGMSDMLVPFLILYEDDERAFLCFRALMSRIRRNFEVGHATMHLDMARVVELIQKQDAQLHSHIQKLGCDDGLWAFRMLLVLMRREIPLDMIFSFWEVLWAGEGLLGQKSLMPAIVAAFVIEHRSEIQTFTDSSQMLDLCNNPPRVPDGKSLVHSALVMAMTVDRVSPFRSTLKSISNRRKAAAKAPAKAEDETLTSSSQQTVHFSWAPWRQRRQPQDAMHTSKGPLRASWRRQRVRTSNPVAPPQPAWGVAAA